MPVFGYARVSTEGQNLERQIQKLKEAGVDERFIYSEKVSGKDFNRKIYQKMKSVLAPNDTLVITDLTRLGRNNEEIKKEWKWLNDNTSGVFVIDMPILDTRTESNPHNQLVADIAFSVLAWEVEYDRQRRQDAQREGIAIAKAQGKYKGKSKTYTEDHPQIQLAFELYDKGEKTVNDIIKQTGLTKPTFYRRLKERENFQNRYNV